MSEQTLTDQEIDKKTTTDEIIQTQEQLVKTCDSISIVTGEEDEEELQETISLYQRYHDNWLKRQFAGSKKFINCIYRTHQSYCFQKYCRPFYNLCSRS